MSSSSKLIGDFLFGQTRSRVLALLISQPDRAFFGREVARHIHTSQGTTRRELEALASFGLVKKSRVGREVFYVAETCHPAYSGLQSLIARTSGVYGQLQAALNPLYACIDFAFVYGSMVRGGATAESDVDIMIVGEVTLDGVLAALYDVEKAILRTVNPTVFSRREFEDKLRRTNHFLHAVLREPKELLIGDAYELETMGRIRLDPA